MARRRFAYRQGNRCDSPDLHRFDAQNHGPAASFDLIVTDFQIHIYGYLFTLLQVLVLRYRSP